MAAVKTHQQTILIGQGNGVLPLSLDSTSFTWDNSANVTPIQLIEPEDQLVVTGNLSGSVSVGGWMRGRDSADAIESAINNSASTRITQIYTAANRFKTATFVANSLTEVADDAVIRFSNVPMQRDGTYVRGELYKIAINTNQTISVPSDCWGMLYISGKTGSGAVQLRVTISGTRYNISSRTTKGLFVGKMLSSGGNGTPTSNGATLRVNVASGNIVGYWGIGQEEK